MYTLKNFAIFFVLLLLADSHLVFSQQDEAVGINGFESEIRATTTPSKGSEAQHSIGGYGELHYNVEKPDGKESTKKLDFHRFIIFYGYAWNREWSFKSEVELEHNVVGDDQGELELEQAYVDYHPSDLLGFQAGVVLPSAGFLNEMHEPPLFFGVERPDYHKLIIPTTWFGNGVALYGRTDSWDYKLTLMEGLNPSKFSAKSAIRGGRAKGFNADAEDLLLNARLNFTGLENFLIGGSFTWNDASGLNTEEIRVENGVILTEMHARFQKDKFMILAEIGNIEYDDPVESVNTALGFYVDAGYDVGELIGIEGNFIPWVRYSNINTAADTDLGGTLEEKFHRIEYSAGLNYKPLPQIVFKADYGIVTVELDDTKTKRFNLGVGYLF